MIKVLSKKIFSFIILDLMIIVFSGNYFTVLAQTIGHFNVNENTNGLSFDIVCSAESFIRSNGNQNIFDYNLSLDESSPGKPILPNQTFIIAIPPYSEIDVQLIEKAERVYENTVVKINPQIIQLTDSSFNYKEVEISSDYLIDTLIPAKEIEIVDYFWIRDFYCAAVKINPVQYHWKSKSLKIIKTCKIDVQFKNILTFQNQADQLSDFENHLRDVIINFSSAQNFRTKRESTSISDSSGNWIDYTKTYHKFSIIKDGIYRIAYDDLTSIGVDASTINPKTIKIFRKGKQLPLFVSGEGDLEFGLTDYIEFYAEKNYGSPYYRNLVSIGQDYLNFMDRYNDTSFVWLTYGGTDGKRIQIQSLPNISTTDTIKSYLQKQHFEQDVRLWYHSVEEPRTQLPFWQEHKVFTWLLSTNSGSQSINFTAIDYVPDTEVKTYTRLISNQFDASTTMHRHGSSINSTIPSDTITYGIRSTANFNSVFSSNELIESNNVYRIFGLPTTGPHRSLVDWVDIEYFRYNKAINDSIVLLIPDTVSTQIRNVTVSNILAADSLVTIYKIGKEFKKIVGFTSIDNRIIFSDTVRGGDRYIISKRDNYITPFFNYTGGLTNLRDNSRGADYIIITHKSLAQSTQEYKEFVESNYKMRVERVFVEDIYDEFGYGQNWAESIKDFLIYANGYWVSPAPSYVNIIGDASYDYKNVWNPAPSPRKKNLVPSYGFPVSDQWYSTLDSSNVNIPQIFLGRIPANNDIEVRSYLTKYQSYLNRRFDDWNKRYNLFSGGDPTNPGELATIKSANDLLMNNIISPAPIGGKLKHFYKTISPSTNFGPFTQEQVNNTIDSSGVIINYIGHSGTRTWDNGITEVVDLESIFQDRLPLISDFGCSTGKFAEPDVDAFGELFVCQSTNGDAIGYLGNSSLGFLSTSISFPTLFYGNLLTDSVKLINGSHILSKIAMMNANGYNDVSRVFNYCNLFFGDPLIKLAVPDKPNYVVNRSSVSLPDQIPDQEDSIKVTISIFNWGKVIQDSLSMIISNVFESNTTFVDTIKIKSPLYETTVEAYIKSKGLVGAHKLYIRVDPSNLIDELYEDDNEQEYIYSIYSTNIRSIVADNYYAINRNSLVFLNPVYQLEGSSDTFTISTSTNPDYINTTDYQVSLDTVTTMFSLNSISNDPRMWYRARLNTSDIKWSANYSFRNLPEDFNWYIDKTHNAHDVILENTKFDTTDFSWKLSEVMNNLRLTSAGSSDGKFASILYNNSEILPNTFFWGIATAEIDTISYTPYNIKYFAWPNTIANNSDSLINYINSLPQGKMLALTICDDAAQTVLGFSGGTPVRRAIETLGSYLIDSVRYRESWCILGVKGAAVGSVPESYKKLFEGFASVEVEKEFFPDSGKVLFPIVKNSAYWESLSLTSSSPLGTNVELVPLGIKNNGSVDTLDVLNLNNGFASLSHISSVVYPQLKFMMKLRSNELNESPVINSLGLNFIEPAELGTNFQVVGLDADTVQAGGNINLTFWVFNVGEANADSFNVKVDVVSSNNLIDTTFNYLVESLNGDAKRKFDLNYQVMGNDLEKKFVINIDSNNRISEFFEDNNFFTKSFYILPDLIAPTIQITFDEMEVVNGDFVSDRPNIKIALSDESPIPIIDTSAIKIYLNEDPVYYGANQSILSYSINSGNPKFVAEYKPELEDGDYLLRVVGKDPNGNTADSASSEVYFVVSSETKLHQVYNYPNPFSNETYFTFRLSQIPQEIKIRIYTIAGRMIKEIIRNPSELNFDLNRIYWDGKDEDGDIVANGTYLYKVFIKHDDKVESVTQKLVIVK
jgi:hypothetical protein